MVKKNIKNTIVKNNLINAGEHIVIGLSGGPDSVCLFSVLAELQDELQITLHAVHVNHGFRPGAAEDDQQYVEQLCRKMGIEYTSFVYDCNTVAEELGLSSEEAGRKVRYESFMTVAEKIDAPKEKIKIAVAQNADDQAETVLFRLMRGTGTDGLAGMAYSRMEKNICVIRPLLDTWREDIETYCTEKQLNPRIDHTNLESVYTRNKIRLDLIPYMEKEFNSNIKETLVRLSSIAAEDKAFLWQQTEDAYRRLAVKPGVLQQQGLAELPAALKHRVIMKALQEQGLMQDVGAAHLEAADRILNSTGESRTVEFPDGYRMSVRYGEAVFYKADASQMQYGMTVRNMDDVPEGELPAASAVFDQDKIREIHGSAEIVLRTRREGDYIAIKGGSKKIQNLFVDIKVPKEQRDKVIFAAVGSEVLWLPAQPEKGVKRARYNQRYKLDMDTKNSLVLEINCET